jgi:hypothetical protein
MLRINHDERSLEFLSPVQHERLKNPRETELKQCPSTQASRPWSTASMLHRSRVLPWNIMYTTVESITARTIVGDNSSGLDITSDMAAELEQSLWYKINRYIN